MLPRSEEDEGTGGATPRAFTTIIFTDKPPTRNNFQKSNRQREASRQHMHVHPKLNCFYKIATYAKKPFISI